MRLEPGTLQVTPEAWAFVLLAFAAGIFIGTQIVDDDDEEFFP